jgi:hypothetical protein
MCVLLAFMSQKPPTHTQDLREAVASIISMMLGVLRAQGWRGLLHLPEIVIVVFLLRSIAKRFAALMDAYAAGTLPVAIPVPAPQERQPAHARATPRVASRPTSARRRHPRRPARAGVRARTVPRPSAPIPLGIAAVTHRQKNCVLAACFSTPILLRYRNEMDVEKQARGAAPAPARGRAPGPYQWGSKGRCP